MFFYLKTSYFLRYGGLDSFRIIPQKYYLNILRHNALTKEDKDNLKRCEVVNTALYYQKNPHIFC